MDVSTGIRQFLLVMAAVAGPLLLILATAPTPEERKTMAAAAIAAAAKERLLAATFERECLKREDATLIFKEEIRAFTGKAMTSSYEARDLLAWDCSNGVRYWGVRGKLPAGFERDYGSVLRAAAE